MSKQKMQTFLVTWIIKKFDRASYFEENETIYSPSFEVVSFDKKEFFMSLSPALGGDKVMCQLVSIYNCHSFYYQFFLLKPNNIIFRRSEVPKEAPTSKLMKFCVMMKTSDLWQIMSHWSEDTLTLQCLMECESNSVTGCEIQTEMHENSEFVWSFDIYGFHGWSASRDIHIAEIPLKVTFRYINKLQIEFTSNLKYRKLRFKCHATLVDEADSDLNMKKEMTLSITKEVIVFPHSFTVQKLQEERNFTITFSLIFSDVYSHNQVIYIYEDNETVTSTVLTSSSSEEGCSIKEAPETDCLSYLQQDLRRLLVGKKFADVELRADDECFSAHKNILAVRSPIFSAMFDQDMVEGKSGIVDIIDVDAKTLKSFLDYIYTSTVDVMDEEIAMNLLVVADKYQVVPLIEKCSAYLKSVLSVTNACKVVLLADMVNNDYLKVLVIGYIVENSTTILTSPEWLQLLKTNNALATDILIKVSKKFDCVTKHV